MTQEEYNSMLASAREQFKQGTPLFGKEGGISSYIGRLSKLRLGRWDGKPPFRYEASDEKPPQWQDVQDFADGIRSGWDRDTSWPWRQLQPWDSSKAPDDFGKGIVR